MKNDMQFTGKNGEFQIRHMVEKTQLNFPVANEEGIKSSVTQTSAAIVSWIRTIFCWNR